MSLALQSTPGKGLKVEDARQAVDGLLHVEPDALPLMHAYSTHTLTGCKCSFSTSLITDTTDTQS